MNKAISINPDKIENYYQRANINLIYGEYGDAIDDFQNYLRIENSDALAYFNLGVAFTLLGDKSKGCEAFQQSEDLGYDAKSEFIKYACRTN